MYGKGEEIMSADTLYRAAIGRRAGGRLFIGNAIAAWLYRLIQRAGVKLADRVTRRRIQRPMREAPDMLAGSLSTLRTPPRPVLTRPRRTAVAMAFLTALCTAMSTAMSTALWADDGALEDRTLAFPSDYKSAFTHYFTGDRVFTEHQTIAIFANEIAVKGAQEGVELPYGSVLVAELYQAAVDETGAIKESALSRRIPDHMAAIAVMERREGWDAQYPGALKVGDWEFELFSVNGENLNKDMTACRECHQPLTDTAHVFSYEHLRAAR